MTRRVDRNTLCCFAHQVQGCVVCMMADFHDALDEAKAKREQLKRERAEMTVDERFDVGGES